MSYICRTCLSESEDFVPITKIINMNVNGVPGKTQKLSLALMLFELQAIKFVADDEMPKTMCEECVYDVCKLFFFKRQCIEADQKLKSMLGIEDTSEDIKVWSEFKDIDELSNTTTENYIQHSDDLQANQQDDILNTNADDSCSDFDNDGDECSMQNYSIDDADVKEEYIESPNDSSKNNYDYHENEETENNYIIQFSPDPEDDPNESKNSNTSAFDFALDEFITNLGFEDDGTKDLFYDLYNSDNDIDDETSNIYPQHPFRCRTCSERFATSDELTAHVAIHSVDLDYQCNICDRMFRTFVTYKDHFRTHDSRITNHCHLCGKQMKDLNKLKKHLVLHENNGGKVSCYFCGIVFGTIGGCRLHMTNKHPSEWKAYKTKLFRLRRKVTAEIQFNSSKHLCHVCGIQCVSPKQLNAHTAQHHSDVRPHKCNICGKGFALANYLKDHVIRHGAEATFECEICGKRFTRKRGLKSHLKRHNGARPYECPICQKGLSTVVARDMHIRTHFGEKPYREKEARRPPRIRRKQTRKPKSTSQLEIPENPNNDMMEK